MKKILRQNSKMIFAIMILIFAMEVVAIAQTNSDNVTSTLNTRMTSIKTNVLNIIGAIGALVAAIGLINASYQVYSGKQESKEKIIMWLVGLIFWGLGWYFVTGSTIFSSTTTSAN